jgi:hypothetical protein
MRLNADEVLGCCGFAHRLAQSYLPAGFRSRRAGQRLHHRHGGAVALALRESGVAEIAFGPLRHDARARGDDGVRGCAQPGSLPHGGGEPIVVERGQPVDQRVFADADADAFADADRRAHRLRGFAYLVHGRRHSTDFTRVRTRMP